MKIFISCLLLPPPYFFIPLIIYLLQYSLSFGKYYITRSFRGSAPLLLAPVVGWVAIQAPRALQAPGPCRPQGPLGTAGAFDPRALQALWEPLAPFSLQYSYISYSLFYLHEDRETIFKPPRRYVSWHIAFFIMVHPLEVYYPVQKMN